MDTLITQLPQALSVNKQDQIIIVDSQETNAAFQTKIATIEQITSGLQAKTARTVAVTDIVLAGLQVIQGVTLLPNDRVLLTAQTIATQNGIYIVSAGTWTRPDEALKNADEVIIYEGDKAGSRWLLTTPNPITLDVTSLSFIPQGASLPLGDENQFLNGNQQFVNIDKTTVGLDDVDNTRDSEKPVSVPVQTAISSAITSVNDTLGNVITTNTATIVTHDVFNAIEREYLNEQIDVRDDYIRLVPHFGGYGKNNGSANLNSIKFISQELDVDFHGGKKFFNMLPNKNVSNSDKQGLIDLMSDEKVGRCTIINWGLTDYFNGVLAGSMDQGIIDFCQWLMAYKATRPQFKGEILIKILHETNLTSGYIHAACNPVNVANAGGILESIEVSKQVFKKIADLFRNNTRLDNKGMPTGSQTVGKPWIKMVMELACANNTLYTYMPVKAFCVNKEDYDIVFFNPYNRYFIASGDGTWRDFEVFCKNVFDQIKEVAGGKPIGIGETATVSGGRVTDTFSNSFTITNGGTGFPANQNATLIPASAITSDGVKPTIRYRTNASGVITNMYANDPGSENTVVTIASSFSGGTGLNVTVRVRGPEYSKANWNIRQLLWIKNNVRHLKYWSPFWENKGSDTDTDWAGYRDWAWNSLEQKIKGAKILRYINFRGEAETKESRLQVIRENLCPDPLTKDITKWGVKGSNPGTISLETGALHMIPEYDVITSVLKIRHNTKTNNPSSFRVWYRLPGTHASNKYFHHKAYIKFIPDDGITNGEFHLGVEKDSNSSFGNAWPPQEAYSGYQWYEAGAADGSGGNVMNGAFQCGTSVPGTFYMTFVKLECGQNPTPIMLTSNSGAVALSNANTWTANQTIDSNSNLVIQRAIKFEDRALAGTNGEVFIDGGKNALVFIRSGLKKQISTGIGSMNTTYTVTNTTTETSLMSIGSNIFPAGYFIGGKAVEIKLNGHYNTGASANIIYLRFTINGVAMVMSGANAGFNSLPLSQANSQWNFYGLLTLRAAGTSGFLQLNGWADFCENSTGQIKRIAMNGSGSSTINTTVNNTYGFTAQWTNASASDNIVTRAGLIQEIY